MKQTGIIFDWDNTLVDTWVLIHKALEGTFLEMGREPWTLQETKEKIGHSLREKFPELFGEDEWERAGKIYLKHYLKFNLKELRPMENAEKTLIALRNAGVPMAVVSNKTGYVLREEIEHIKWKDYFVSMIGAKDTKRDKPDAEPALLAFKGCDLGEIWFVGDSVIDVKCAENAGYKSVHIGDGKLIPDYVPVVKNHTELLDFFQKQGVITVPCGEVS